MRAPDALLTVLAALAAVVASAAPPAHPGRPVDILGRKLWVEEAGAGEPLLLIPGGGGGSHDYFHPHFEALHEHFRVVYYDGFGRGRSERAKRPDEYSVERDVQEIDALRRALGIERWHVYGHSYGGLVAQAYAARYPQSVSRLVLANTFVSAEDYQASNDHFVREVREYLPEVSADLAALRSGGHLSSSPEVQKVIFGDFTRMLALFYLYDRALAPTIVFDEHSFNAEQYYRLMGADADFVLGGEVGLMDFRAVLPKLKMPILVTAGRADGIVLPRLARRVHEHAPGSKWHVFEKSGHFPFMEETAAHAATLIDFLRGR
jgi:proline iminopeptidase